MKYKDVVSKVKVYGLKESFKASKYPMATDLKKLNDEVTNTIKSLAASSIGSGHDNFLNGIIVQFDLCFSNKAWVEMQRYHFIDFVSSQSTMHRITKFDLDKAYIKYVDKAIIKRMKELVNEYNKLHSINPKDPKLNDLYLKILYSNPAGFRLSARMTTNYRQLKTIYHQRKNHRLPEWKAFCEFIKTLPYANIFIKEAE